MIYLITTPPSNFRPRRKVMIDPALTAKRGYPAEKQLTIQRRQREMTLAARDIVPGDVVQISEGETALVLCGYASD